VGKKEKESYLWQRSTRSNGGTMKLRLCYSVCAGTCGMRSVIEIWKKSCKNAVSLSIIRRSIALVQHYAPELEKRCRPHLKATTDSWRVDETYVKVKKVWRYLYRAVDSQGNTLEFFLSPKRDAQAAKRFFAKALNACHTVTPRVITVDKNAAYPRAFNELKTEGFLSQQCELRQSKYLNNLVEQDHRFIKRLVKPGMGFFSFEPAWRTLQGYEAMHMIRKGQMQGVNKGDCSSQATFIAELFGVAI
jgi:transposase, IS6 family